MSIKLVMISGPNRGATYFLEEGETLFGRGADAGIVLANSQVSKKHISLVCAHGRVELKDLAGAVIPPESRTNTHKTVGEPGKLILFRSPMEYPGIGLLYRNRLDGDGALNWP